MPAALSRSMSNTTFEQIPDVSLDQVTGGAKRRAQVVAQQGHPVMAQQGASSCSYKQRSPFGPYGIRTEKGPATGEG